MVRGDDGSQTVTVEFATSDGTAIAGRDYAGITNRLSFFPTERLKAVAVPLLNDSAKEPNKPSAQS